MGWTVSWERLIPAQTHPPLTAPSDLQDSGRPVAHHGQMRPHLLHPSKQKLRGYVYILLASADLDHRTWLLTLDASGVSLLTQLFYALVFVTRYTDLFRESYAWNYFFK